MRMLWVQADKYRRRSNPKWLKTNVVLTNVSACRMSTKAELFA